MGKSELENWNDKLLFLIIKQLKNTIDLDSVENSGDYQFTDAVESISSMFSINSDSINCDYLYNLWKLNEESFEFKNLQFELIRPKLKTYSYTYRERRSTVIDDYWENNISLYTEIDGVNNLLYTLKSEGMIEPWDGNNFDSETVDSEFIDDEIEDINEI